MTEKQQIKQRLTTAVTQLETAIDICNSNTIDLWEVYTHLQIAEDHIQKASADLAAISLAALQKIINETRK